MPGFRRESGDFSAQFVQGQPVALQKRGVLRGRHYQKVQTGRESWIRVLQGGNLDVVVDLRAGNRVNLTENWSGV